MVVLLDYPPRALFSKVKGASHTLEAGQLGSDDVISHIGIVTIFKSLRFGVLLIVKK